MKGELNYHILKLKYSLLFLILEWRSKLTKVYHDGLAQERSRDARKLINKINPKSLSITSRIYTFFSKFFNIVMY